MRPVKKPTNSVVDLAEMKAMLEWEARQDGDLPPKTSPDLLLRWLQTNSASVRNIKQRIQRWKAAPDSEMNFISPDGNTRKS